MKRLYVLVRGDLSRSQQAVQAGHAVAGWCVNEASRTHWDGRTRERKPWRWLNETLIYLTVPDEKSLREWFELVRKPEDFFGLTEGAVAWYEPDLDDQMAAFAVVMEDDEMFRDLPLL